MAKQLFTIDTAMLKEVSVSEGNIAKLKGEKAEMTKEQGADKVHAYSYLVADLNSLPKKADGHPTAAVGKRLVDDLEAHCGITRGTAERYWKTGRATVKKLNDDHGMPTQADASWVKEVLKANGIENETQLQKFVGNVATSDKVEQVIDKIFGKVNKATGIRNGNFDESEFNRLQTRIVEEQNIQARMGEAKQIAEAEDRKIADVLKELVGNDD